MIVNGNLMKIDEIWLLKEYSYHVFVSTSNKHSLEITSHQIHSFQVSEHNLRFLFQMSKKKSYCI